MTHEPIPIEPPIGADETAALIGALERQRRTFRWKADGLNRTAMSVTIGASTLTIAGLLKHLAFVESYYFSTRLHGRSPGEPWASVDWDNCPDWDWRSAEADTPDHLYTLWDDAVLRSRALLAEALTAGGFDQAVGDPTPDGAQPNLRNMIVDLVEEYARHTGHSDLIRESIDGRTGEDAPRDW